MKLLTLTVFTFVLTILTLFVPGHATGTVRVQLPSPSYNPPLPASAQPLILVDGVLVYEYFPDAVPTFEAACQNGNYPPVQGIFGATCSGSYIQYTKAQARTNLAYVLSQVPNVDSLLGNFGLHRIQRQ